MLLVEVPAGPQPLPLFVCSHIPPPFRHGFTTRAGGVSAPPFDTLNLGMRWGDSRENVIENRRRVLLGAGALAFHMAAQVHGAAVVCVRANDDPEATARVAADVLCANDPDVALAVFVADCVPLVFADPVTGAFAVAHGGWRGTVAGVVEAAVAALGAHFGARPGDLRVALGPAIGGCCFEVGPEVVDAFVRCLPELERLPGVLDRSRSRPHIDLRRAQQIALERLGVEPAHIDRHEGCTKCEPGRFFSYRRDGKNTGQQLGFVVRGP